ncbi:MAG TPA: family 20 glycosylhydrolase [Cytophagaceae bacterium]|nr:family 20 glycosylhydrolase [Cytophagaceae bacterium]
MRILNKITFILLSVILFFACKNQQTDLNNNYVSSSSAKKEFATLNLMPVPASLKRTTGNYQLTKNFTLNIQDGADRRLYEAANRFLRRLDGRTGLFFLQGVISKEIPQSVQNPSLYISAQRTGKVALYEDESYTLIVTPEKITLEAITDIGALRGMETLLQLLETNETGYYFPCVEIKDQPRFPWRGLMIDAARHFQPLEVLKRNIDGMAAVKMNVLHFHLCDNQGWRVESKTFPKLHQLASDGQYYTQNQIKEIIEYAADRGIRVMPEFDVPGHATAILVAFPELGSAPGPYQLERNAGIFNPVLDPTNEKTYLFLDKLFTEMASLFPDPYFHIGGDENNGVDWKSNEKIQAFMKKNGMKTTLDLQTYFNNKLIRTIQKSNKKMMGWEEILSDNLTKDAIIHSWFGKESLYRAASKGYQTLLSNGYYIDLLLPASEHYKADPLPPFEEWSEKEKQYKLTSEQEKLILGGEATMWAELVTPFTIDSRIWPRTAAIAERLWSLGTVKDEEDMYRRLEVVSFRLEELGLTHLKNKDALLRNIANGGDIRSLKVLAEVIEPYKVYSRNNGGLMYKSYSPYTLMADAATSDAREARIFRKLVKQYSSVSSKEDAAELKKMLNVWKGNHIVFLEIMNNSPVLKPLENLSANLSAIAEVGLEALDKNTSSENWYKEKTSFLKTVKDSSAAKRNSDKTFEDGRCEIMIVDAVQTLVDLTNKELASKRLEAEKAEEDKKRKEAESAGH